NGKAAPIVYGSIGQWNVVVPYEVDGLRSATIQAVVGDVASEVWTVPVAASSPGVFTSGSTGTGFAAAVDQDGSANSSSNPAPRGTVISLFVTGEGQTRPAGITGSVAGTTGPSPKLPVSVDFAGRSATVQFAGAAPGLISGVMQVNVLIPSDISAG